MSLTSTEEFDRLEKHFKMCSNREGDWRFCLPSWLRNFPGQISTVFTDELEGIRGPLESAMSSSRLVLAGAWLEPNPPALVTLPGVGLGLEALDHKPLVPAECVTRDWL